jgi:hypothetical protein
MNTREVNGRRRFKVMLVIAQAGTCFYVCMIGLLFCIGGALQHKEGCNVGCVFFGIAALASLLTFHPLQASTAGSAREK